MNGYGAAYTALRRWLDDEPSHHYLTNLNHDELKDASTHLLILLGSTLSRIYGSQRDAAQRFSLEHIYRGFPE